MPSGHAVRVLVVEDEYLIAMAIEETLLAMGCEVIGPFAQLGDALAAADCGNFDCAILDVNIRGGLSYPVAERLIKLGFPILLATGYRNGTLPESLVHEACLAKPYSSAQLESELQRLCERVH